MTATIKLSSIIGTHDVDSSRVREAVGILVGVRHRI